MISCQANCLTMWKEDEVGFRFRFKKPLTESEMNDVR